MFILVNSPTTSKQVGLWKYVKNIRKTITVYRSIFYPIKIKKSVYGFKIDSLYIGPC